MNIIRSFSFKSLLAAGFLFMLSAPALAHGPELVAEAVCDENGALVINFTASSWTTGVGGGNPQIDILVNGVKVAEGSFGPVSYSFSGSVPAPAGTSAAVTAVAVGQWDDGVGGGQTSWVTVNYPQDSCIEPGFGRFTGGGHQIRVGDVRVTRGLTVHCDLLLSNNLEINWGGNKFHMTEHLVTVACTDDPLIVQAPPAAPLDTLIGVGTGRYNNVSGFTVEFTLQDFGEPGTSDRMAIYVYETANPGNVVLNVPLQVLTGGNLQAHYDQPHK